MSRPVTLVAWEDATKKPPDPDDGWPVATDGGVATYVESEGQDGRISGGAWYHGEGSDYMDPHPSVWCDPTPPGPDALTVEDLRTILSYIGYSRDWSKVHIEDEGDRLAGRAAARLRAALDALENGGPE